MALTAEEQEFFDAAAAAMPHWFWSIERANEFLGLAAKMAARARTQLEHWLVDQTAISTSTGATSDEPDWLAQHARDRGTSRQAGETDAQLRKRLRLVGTVDVDGDGLRLVPDSITRQALLAFIEIILESEAITPNNAMLELPRDQAFIQVMGQVTGTGGVFAGPSSGAMTFTPTVKFPFPLVVNTPGPVAALDFVISGAANAGNNGSFTVTSMSGDGAVYANGSGVAATDPTVSWQIFRETHKGALMDAWRRSYFDRGHRMGRVSGSVIVPILPYNADAAKRTRVLKQVREMLRLRKGAGIIARVEMRETPP